MTDRPETDPGPSIPELPGVPLGLFDHRLSFLLASLLFLLLAALLFDLVASLTPLVSDVELRPLQADGALLVVAMVLWVVAVLLAATADRLRRVRSPYLRGAIITSLVAFPAVLSVAALEPGPGPFALTRQYVLPPVPKEIQRSYVFVTFFPHDSAELTPAERQRLEVTTAVLGGCGVNEIQLFGFASSARFAEYHEPRNLALANKRARVVSDLLNEQGLEAEIWNWNERHEPMMKARGIRDVAADQSRILHAESLNRRVEIHWKGNCHSSVRPDWFPDE